jgi:hypothetical protein
VLAVGATTLVSHASGRKDQERAIFLFNQSQVLSLVVGILFLAVAMAFRHQYAAGQSATEGMRIATEQYLLWFIPAMALQFAMVAMGAALRGTGNFKPGMWVQTGTVVVNIVLAPFLIFGWGPFPELGVSGAAVATLLAIVVGVVWISFYFIDAKAYLRFHFGSSKPQFRVWWEMLKIGLPAGAEFALMGIYMAVIYAITKPFGAAAQGGFTIGLRIVQSAFLPVVALGFAVAPVAGQNGGRAELCGAQGRPRARGVQGRGGPRGRGDASGRHRDLLRRHRVDADLHQRSRSDRRRRGLLADRHDHLRRLRHHVRVFEHVPGNGQYHAVARDLTHAPDIQRHPGGAAVARRGLPPALDLVRQRGRGLSADDGQSHPASA